MMKFNYLLKPSHIPKFGAGILMTKEMAVPEVLKWIGRLLSWWMNIRMGKQTSSWNSITHHQWARVCNCLLDWYGQYWWPQFPFMVIFVTHMLTLLCPYQAPLHYLLLPLGTIINLLTLQTHRKKNVCLFQIKFHCVQVLSKPNDVIFFSI